VHSPSFAVILVITLPENKQRQKKLMDINFAGTKLSNTTTVLNRRAEFKKGV
jgi:hypothetical protein